MKLWYISFSVNEDSSDNWVVLAPSPELAKQAMRLFMINEYDCDVLESDLVEIDDVVNKSEIEEIKGSVFYFGQSR
jgi:hypothetical protein